MAFRVGVVFALGEAFFCFDASFGLSINGLSIGLNACCYIQGIRSSV